MPATSITAATRYFPTGTTSYYFCPSIASKAAPTRAEMNAGTRLDVDVNKVDGWQVTSEVIGTPDLATRFTSQIPGRITASDSSLTMYASTDGVDVRGLLPRDTAGFIVRLDAGDTAGRKMDVFPIKVTALSKDMGTGDEAALITVMFAITSEPAENVTIPA
jgi:hypothetical protein